MIIFKKFTLLLFLLLFNQYMMEKNNFQDDLKYGIFTLGISQALNQAADDHISSFNLPTYPGIIVQQGENTTLRKTGDLEHEKAIFTGKAIACNNSATLHYPLLSYIEGPSGGIMYLASEKYFNDLPLWNKRHCYEVDCCFFGTGKLNLEEKPHIRKTGGLFIKLLGLSEFLKKPKVKDHSILFLAKDEEQHLNIIKTTLSEFLLFPHKILFISEIKELIEKMDEEKKLIQASSKIMINTKDRISEDAIHPTTIASHASSIIMAIFEKIINPENGSEEIIYLYNLFIEYYIEYANILNTEERKCLHEIFYALLYRLAGTNFFDNFLNIFLNLLLDVSISIENKKAIINVIANFANEKIQSEDNDFESLRIIKDNNERIIQAIEELLQKNQLYKSLLESLKNMRESFKVACSKKLLYIQKTEEYFKTVEKHNLKRNDFELCFSRIIEKYSHLFKIITTKEFNINKKYKEYNNFNIIKMKELGKEYKLETLEDSILNLIERITSEYSNNELYKLLDNNYGLNSFEAQLPTKKFFEILKENNLFSKENMFLIFLYLDTCIEKNIFELDNSEFKVAWKTFILQWIQENLCYEQFSLLLFYWSLNQYKKIPATENIKDKKNFYCDLFSNIIIYNNFNEYLLIYMINIINNEENNLNDFFITLAKKAFSINNNFIKKYIFDLIINKLLSQENNLILYESFATLFFTFSEETQHWYLEKIKNNKYMIYALIKFITCEFKKNNSLHSLHPEILISGGWLVNNESLTLHQNMLHSLLNLLNNITIDENDLKEPSEYSFWYYSLDNKFTLNNEAKEYPIFLSKLLEYIKKNKNKEDKKQYSWITKKLQEKLAHYTRQKEIASEVKNKYATFYDIILKEINDIMKEHHISCQTK